MIFFDLETSRIDRDAEIAWIGAIRTTGAPDFQVIDTFDQKVLFDVGPADEQALEVFGFDLDVWGDEGVDVVEALADFNTFLEPHADVYPKFSESLGRWVNYRRTAAFNAAFDITVLMETAKHLRTGSMFMNIDPSALCVRQLAEWYFLGSEDKRPKNLQLGTLAEYFNIKIKGELHNPVTDCEVTRRLVRKIWRSVSFS